MGLVLFLIALVVGSPAFCLRCSRSRARAEISEISVAAAAPDRNRPRSDTISLMFEVP